MLAAIRHSGWHRIKSLAVMRHPRRKAWRYWLLQHSIILRALSDGDGVNVADVVDASVLAARRGLLRSCPGRGRAVGQVVRVVASASAWGVG